MSKGVPVGHRSRCNRDILVMCPEPSFKYNLESKVQENQGHYLGCLLKLAQSWIAKGCSEWAGTPLGGFERHAAVVGGILEAAGVCGFMQNRDKLNALVKTDDPVSDFMGALIAENKETGRQFEGTLFKVETTDTDVPSSLRKHRMVSFSDVLNQEVVPVIRPVCSQLKVDQGFI